MSYSIANAGTLRTFSRLSGWKVVPALGLALLATPAMAEFSGYVTAEVFVPKVGDTGTTLELGLNYTLPIGIYTTLAIISHDFSASGEKFQDEGSIELTVGFPLEMSDAVALDVGLYSFRAPASGSDLTTEGYFGASLATSEVLDLSLYGYKALNSGVNYHYIEAGMNYALSFAGLSATYTKGFQDDPTNKLKVGLGFEPFENHGLSISYVTHFDSSEDNRTLLNYTINF
jgi:hypothetical protein